MTRLRVVSYNIHKGVQGFGPTRRLEIHNLGYAVAQFGADLVCLQEVRKLHRRESAHFAHWPDQPQADYLAPEGYTAVYRSNAFTRHGEHGNAILSRWPVVEHRHEDMSDHRFEQRGLLHAVVQCPTAALHVIVVHLGLIRASRARQLAQLLRYIDREVPPGAPLVVAGDFNDGPGFVRRAVHGSGLLDHGGPALPTFPSRLPLLQLDHVLARGLVMQHCSVPRGLVWARMSDHLPLLVDLELTA